MATYSSNIITNSSPAKFGVYPQVVQGYVSIGASVVLATTDTIKLCLIPANTILVPSFVIDFGDLDSGTTLTMTLVDDVSAASLCYGPTGSAVTSPNTYIAATSAGRTAGSLLTAANLAHGLIGTSYQTQQTLSLVPGNNATGAAGAAVIYFAFSFAPI